MQILHLAAYESQDAVADALRHLLATEHAIDIDRVRELVADATRIAAPTDVTMEAPDRTSQLTDQLKELRLPAIRDQFQETAVRAATENLSHLDYLLELVTNECEARRESRIKRHMKRSKLPPGKTWDNFDFKRLPLQFTRQLESLRDGSFLDRRENLLMFGKPG